MARGAKAKPFYRVIFLQHGQLYEVYAREVTSSSLFGFLEVADLQFSRSEIIADPSEEKLKQEFSGVSRVFIPYHAVLRIDQVEKAGTSRIAEAKGEVMPFPLPMVKRPEGH